ncbi:hypothetical protein Poli38472_008261 [Pythium oligandrum]|uniref:Biogenesis of lysosome-related organelles complex 1 subunit 7 n=1 Tax=Pythium oligandrum TaxID=41045 RepID=A0A8K1CLB1_PYTOL|nr:hypothetical protein Poli38472_008261 [Pythium oligandrum]|eukprot:TMW65619.1 hypothetical protein Poli38472_008261 [Pythium oligandrum]
MTEMHAPAAATSAPAPSTTEADGPSAAAAVAPVEGSFAKGMYVAVWPKIEKCHSYVAVLLAAQEQLQETVDRLLAGLNEAEQAEESSLVGYADRLKNFPGRVERLQRKLELIEDRLLALKEARNRGASCVTKYNRETALHASPLF